MPLSLYDATIPSYRQIIAATSALIDKAVAHETADATLIEARLAPDMLPLGYQIKSVAEHSQGAIEGVRAGVYSPSTAPWPDNFAALKAKLADADAFLAALDPSEIEGFIGQDMAFEFGQTRMPFTAETFLLSFAQPNFYFHAATAYDILRAQGLKIGKRDFMGMPRLKL
ncbi:DUF1993 family protein [Novosphingobium sp. Gsoil 351]|uniref:DUF1993 domain-containing protein n=1 Tax=Novosphingobium sp. Gsoil 351 TaxID=2675225 RepID=UPI0012B4BC1F|nr:DUF1993 domain-containing protein [Novosphingobium sp. Gsoil 351]QGN55360.1 DUF1993 family protein [Novosphingobium sp. Gsoil 351]